MTSDFQAQPLSSSDRPLIALPDLPLHQIFVEGLDRGDIRLDAQGNYAFENQQIAQTVALALLQSPDQLTQFLESYGDRLAAIIQAPAASDPDESPHSEAIAPATLDHCAPADCEI